MTNTGWISVNDRLPKSGLKVLTSRMVPVHSEKGTVNVAIQVTDILAHIAEQLDDFWITCQNGGKVEGEVTHWMPLPKPPEE